MKLFKLVSALALLSASAFSFAGSASSGFGVGTTATANCTISSSSGINFGTYSMTANSTSSGTVGLICSNTIAWTLSMNKGTTSGGAFSNRLMANGSNSVGYNVYKDSGFTSILGDGTGGSTTVTGTGNGTSQTTTVYGKMPFAQYSPSGSYSDTLTVTVSY